MEDVAAAGEVDSHTVFVARSQREIKASLSQLSPVLFHLESGMAPLMFRVGLLSSVKPL